MKRQDEVVEREIDGNLVLYDLKHQRAHVLNPTASIIWRLCDGTHTSEEIAAQVIAMFPSEAAAIPEDITILLDLLDAEHLLIQ